jgi:hypothetical protein
LQQKYAIKSEGRSFFYWEWMNFNDPLVTLCSQRELSKKELKKNALLKPYKVLYSCLSFSLIQEEVIEGDLLASARHELSENRINLIQGPANMTYTDYIEKHGSSCINFLAIDLGLNP